MSPTFIKQFQDARQKLALAYPLVRHREIAIDGGAHIGAWSLLLAQCFHRVYAFEPFPPSFTLLCKYLKKEPRVVPLLYALGDECCQGTMVFDGKHTPHFEKGSVGESISVTLDSMAFTHVGLIKMDLEGNEYNALLGAEQLIRREQPVMILEVATKPLPSHQYGRSPEAPLSLLKSWGATQVAYVAPDYIYHFVNKEQEAA